MKIGIFGGSFNPVHNMHTDIAKYLINNNYLDKIIFVPAGTKYKYKNNLISNKDRYNMLLLSTKELNNIEVSNYELKDNLVYTYQTLDYYKKQFPNDEIYFICGADNLDYIDKWEKGTYILNTYNIILIARNTFNTKDLLSKYKDYHITLANINMNNISSTIIRNNINNNIDVSKYLNTKVLEYIKEHNLYKE